MPKVTVQKRFISFDKKKVNAIEFFVMDSEMEIREYTRMYILEKNEDVKKDEVIMKYEKIYELEVTM